jgi:hypothetical protein
MGIINTLELGEGAEQAFVPSLPVSCAVLCVDCERITVSFHDGCPICGSKSLLNIAQILGGTLSSERTRAIDPHLEIIRCA